jgi:effector-binding domain-containing protein
MALLPFMEVIMTEQSELDLSTKRKEGGTQQSAIKAYLFLTDNLTKYENGLCDYKESWTDVKVAEHLNMSISTVSKTRRENFGELKSSRDRKLARMNNEDRITGLEQLVGKQERTIRDLLEWQNTTDVSITRIWKKLNGDV